MSTPPTDTRQRLREARAQLALKQTEAQLALLESWGDFGGYGYGSAPQFSPFEQGGAVGAQRWIPVGGVGGRYGDRQQGGDHPFLWTEVDLERSRALARWLAHNNPLAQGILANLTNYTVRTGYTYEAQPGRRHRQDAAAKALAGLVQEVIEETQDLNVLGETATERLVWADRERESVLRNVRDGEVFLRTFDQGDGSTLVRAVEPEQVRRPLGSPEDWSWGCRNAPHDVERILSYAVHYGDPDDWEEVPASEISHLKSNTDCTVKRGLSDFLSTGQALEEVNKLLRAMRVSGAAQASIAWIEQHTGANQAGLDALVAKARNLNPPTLVDPFSGREVSGQTVQAGQRLLIGGGRQYQSAPLAANTTQHIAIVQAVLRAIGARWCLPEYMISGDASNANYASTLVSGAPHVTFIECLQAILGRFFVRVLWQAVRNAARAGRFRLGGRVYEYSEVSRLVDVVPTPPQVAISDKSAEAQSDAADIAAGVMSLQTRRARVGLDDEVERKNLAEEPPTRVPGRATDLDAQGNPVQQPGGSGQHGGLHLGYDSAKHKHWLKAQEGKDASGHEHASDADLTPPAHIP